MSTKNTSWRIMIVDGQTLVREALSLLVDSWDDMEVVAQARDAQEAWQLTRQLSPRVIVLDIPNRHFLGVQVTKRLKLSYPRVRVLGLAGHLDQVHISQMVKVGMVGYVLKTSASQELEQAIRFVAEGGFYLDSHIEGRMINGELCLTKPNVIADSLSPVQLEILKMVALGYSNGEIGRMLHFSVKTIESHKAIINQNLGLRTKVDLVRLAHQQGWLTNEN